MRTLNTIQFSQEFPKPFLALPELYQNDSCLEFYSDTDYLACSPTQDQISVLGDWKAFYNPDENNWVTLEEPI